MPRKRCRSGKRNVSEPLDDEAKENNAAEMSEDAVSADPSSPCPINKKVKMEAEDEPPASKLKSDYWRSSSLSHARLPNFTPVKNVPVKSENPSDVVLSTAAISLQDSGIGSPSVATPKSEPADEAAADSACHCSAPSQAAYCLHTSHPLSEMHAVVGKPTPVGKSETAARNEAVFNAGSLSSPPRILPATICSLSEVRSVVEAKDSASKSEENETSYSSISPSCAPALLPMAILTFCEEQSVVLTSDMISERKETTASPVSANCPGTLPEMNCQMQDVSKVHCPETSRVLEQVAESLMEIAGQTDEVEVVEISKKEFEVVDLTDDVVSPASTLPPSPATEDPETGPILPRQNLEFPTPLLPFIKEILDLNIETILEIEALFSEVELVALSSEDEKEGTADDESVIMCDPPSDNGMEQKQAEPIESDDDDITILEIPQSSKLAVKLSTSPKHENLTVLSNILAPPSQNILPSTPMNLECFGTASPIVLETSSSSKAESVVLPTTPSIQELFPAVVPATSETAPSQSVVFPSTPPIKEPFPVVIPAISESAPSQTAVHRPTIQDLFTTAVPALSETAPSKNTKSIVPLTPPKQSADDHSVAPMDISPPSTSPVTKSVISSDRISKNVLLDIIKKTDNAHIFAPIQNTASNLDSTRNTISSLFQQPSVAQTKRPLSPENASQNQHASKRLGINEYRMRKIADPRRRSTSPLTTPSLPVTNSPQTASPHSANGNYFSPPQSNFITVFPFPQYQLQSNLLPAQALTQYPVQNHFNLANRTRTQYLLQNIVPPSPQHQSQNLSHEERTAQLYAQQFSSGGIAPPSRLPISNHPSHFDRRNPHTRYAPVPSVQPPLHNVHRTQPPLPSTQPPKQPSLPSTQPAMQSPLPSTQPAMQPPLPSTQPAMQPPLPSTHQTRPPLGARPHLPPTKPFAPRATNLLQSVRQVAVASVVRPPTRLAQPYSGEQQPRSFVSSVPASLRGSVGQRLIPSDVLHLIIIDWDVTAMHDLYRKNEFPKSLATEFNQVRNSYTDLLDYYNTYFPLMLVEFWNKIFAAYNAHQRKEFFFCVTNFQVNQTQVDDDTCADTYLVTCNTVVRTCDIELIPKSMQVCAINCLSGRFLGYVREAFRRDYSEYHDKSHATLERNSLSADDGDPKSKMRLIIEFACSPFPLKPKDLFACSKLANVKGLLKQNETLLRLEGSSLMRVLLNPLMEQWVELIRLPLSKKVDEMSVALSALTYRVRHRDHHVTLVGFSEKHERADQLMALVQIVQRLRHGIGRRLLVCCREEKMEEVAEKIHSLGFETVLLERELRSLGDPYLSFDALAKKSSVRHVLENCEVMLAATGYCFYEDLLDEAEASGAHFDTCVIFDAHCLTEPESLVPLAYPVRHLVLVGVPGKLSKTSAMTAHWEFGKSLFQRAYDTSG